MKDNGYDFPYCEPEHHEHACKCEEKHDDCMPPKTHHEHKQPCECGKKPKRPCRCGGTCFKEPKMKRINCCPLALRGGCRGTRCCCKCQRTCCDCHPCRCGA